MRCSTTFASGCSRTPIRALAGLIVLLLAGCAGQTRPAVDLPELADWPTRETVLQAADDWAFSGRIGIRTEDDGFNASLRHSQRGRRFESTLGGPLGVGKLRIEGNARRILLIDRDGRRIVLDEPEADLQRLYGWTIPVTSLRFWALGVPDPDSPAEVTLDADARLAELRQRGWRVVVDRYRDYRDAALPRRITASNGTTRVRVVIDQWLFFDQ